MEVEVIIHICNHMISNVVTNDGVVKLVTVKIGIATWLRRIVVWAITSGKAMRNRIRL